MVVEFKNSEAADRYEFGRPVQVILEGVPEWTHEPDVVEQGVQAPQNQEAGIAVVQASQGSRS